MRYNHALVVFFVLAGFPVLMGIADTQASRPPANMAGSPSSAVVVELFTSEGCSSCPPADALLKKLSEERALPGVEIIALEEHVDYWDHLGWKDPFSSSAFTERQNDYARKFGNSGVYTPQMVVDGQTEFVGSRSREAREVIQKAAAQAKVAVTVTPAAVTEQGKAAFDIKVANLSMLPAGKEVELWAAITERNLHTDVKAGENSGERLQHAAVVRALRKLETFRGPGNYQAHSSFKFESSWQTSKLSYVAFVAEKGSQKIIGAAEIAIAKSNTR